MPKLKPFWRLLETRPSRTAVTAEWERVAGDHLAVVTPLLVPTDEVATTYPDPTHASRRLRVVRHAEGAIVGIDDSDWQRRVPLTHEDIVLYRLDLRALRKALCESLSCVNIARTPLDPAARRIQVGNWEPKKAAAFAAKTNGQPKGVIPIGCNHLTLFIDVQQRVLFWMLCAWEENFTGYIADYGTWPEQKRAYFTLNDVTSTLGRALPGAGMEGQLYAGLEKLTAERLSRAYRREDGAEMRIDRCLVDANWGQSTDVVYQFCRQSQYAGILLPSHGKYVGASSVPFSEYKRKRGDRIGLHWRIPNTTGKRQVRHALVDTNYWKTFVHARLAVSMGDPGCLSLFGHDEKTHRMLADHLTAEYRVKAMAQGRTVDEWKLRPTRPDNHWLDCLVGCAVAASIQGASLAGVESRALQARPRLRLSNLQSGRSQ